MDNKNLNEQSFEDLMANLKVILDTLEKGELKLEDSMKAYESGVALVRVLEEKLRAMEGRMEEILADGSIQDLQAIVSKPE